MQNSESNKTYSSSEGSKSAELFENLNYFHILHLDQKTSSALFQIQTFWGFFRLDKVPIVRNFSSYTTNVLSWRNLIYYSWKYLRYIFWLIF